MDSMRRSSDSFRVYLDRNTGLSSHPTARVSVVGSPNITFKLHVDNNKVVFITIVIRTRVS